MNMTLLSKIRIDGGTQSRAALNDEVVSDYVELIRGGSDFPPVVLFFDGKDHWLGDGFHRYHAYKRAGAVEIAADVRDGTKRDAVLFSATQANRGHGLQLSREDKRTRVRVLLADEEWSQWSDREIARECGVSHEFVRKLRPVTVNVDSEARRYKTKHGSPAVMDTAKIGNADKAERARQQAEFDRQREEARKALRPEVQAIEQAKQRNGATNAAVPGISADDRIAELEEAVRALEAENATLKAENKLYSEMKAEFEQGGFAAVIEGKEEVIRAQLTRIERESQDKAAWKRTADLWRKRAEEAGYSNNAVIDIETGEIIHHA